MKDLKEKAEEILKKHVKRFEIAEDFIVGKADKKAILSAMQEYAQSLQKESKTDLKMCTGCGKFSDEKIKPTALACCPDSNYIKATGELIKKDYVWKYSLPKSKTDVGEVEKFMDSKEIEIEEYISKNGYKMHSLSTDGECLTTQGIIEMCVKYISEYYKLQTKEEKERLEEPTDWTDPFYARDLSEWKKQEEKEKVNCKYVKREGESCTLNDNCKYPKCEEKESGIESFYTKEELLKTVISQQEIIEKMLSSQTVTDWISVEDRLPNTDRPIIMYGEGHVMIGFHFLESFIDALRPNKHITDITHWQPLPQPPNKLTNKE